MLDRILAVRASERARDALRALARDVGDLVIVQSAGCCDGSAPMVLLAADFPLGASDVQIGAVEGIPVIIHSRELNAWSHGDLELDIEPGYADGLSFAAGDGLHFVSRFTACPAGPDITTTQKEES